MDHLGEPLDRGQRRTQFIAHVSDECGLDLIGSLQRLVAVAQRTLHPAAVGDVEHREQCVAVGKRHRGKVEMTTVAELHPPAPLHPFGSRKANQLADQRRSARVGQLPRRLLCQRIDMRMPGEKLFLESPNGAELVVPDQQSPVRPEHANRFVQIVERRGAGTQQRVARGGKLDLLGPVLEDQQQPAFGKRLRDDAQMNAAGQMPRLFDRPLARKEPLAAFFLPSRKVANLGHALGFAHSLEHAVEFGAIRQPFGPHREHPPKRLIAKGQCAVGTELRHARRQQVEHRSLRLGEALQPTHRLFEFVDIDRESRSATARQRHVMDAHHPARAVDRRWHVADQWLARLPCL